MTTCMYVGRDAIPYVSKKCVRSEDRFQVDTLTFSYGVILLSRGNCFELAYTTV